MDDHSIRHLGKSYVSPQRDYKEQLQVHGSEPGPQAGGLGGRWGSQGEGAVGRHNFDTKTQYHITHE